MPPNEVKVKSAWHGMQMAPAQCAPRGKREERREGGREHVNFHGKCHDEGTLRLLLDLEEGEVLPEHNNVLEQVLEIIFHYISEKRQLIRESDPAAKSHIETQSVHLMLFQHV